MVTFVPDKSIELFSTDDYQLAVGQAKGDIARGDLAQINLAPCRVHLQLPDTEAICNRKSRQSGGKNVKQNLHTHTHTSVFGK